LDWKEVKKILTNSGIYIGSVLFNKGLNFALLPILTHYLSQNDYGTLALVASIAAIASVIIGLFPNSFIIARFALYGKEKIASYMHNIMLITIVSYCFVLTILLLFKDFILPETMDQKTTILVLISFYSLFNVAFNVLDTLFQVEKNSVKFAVLQTLQSVSAVGLTLLLVIEFSYQWEGKFYADLVVLGTIAIFCIWYIRKNHYYKKDTDVAKIKELTFFLVPITFNALGLFILGTFDRILISHMVSLEAAGIYAVAITMAFIVNIVYDSIMKAILPYFHDYLAEGTEQSKWEAVKLTYIYSVGCILILSVYILVLPYIFHFMIDPKFNKALDYIPLLALALTFEGLRKVLGGYFTFHGKVNLISMITIGAALTNVVLNYFLIKIYGAMGSVITVLATFALLYFTNLFLLLKFFKMPWFGKFHKGDI
jgi:O-antigen/teichoic acid export membrane protein